MYAPVMKYGAYLEGLTFFGLNIVEVAASHVLTAVDIGAQEGLRITDAAHVTVMQT